MTVENKITFITVKNKITSKGGKINAEHLQVKIKCPNKNNTKL